MILPHGKGLVETAYLCSLGMKLRLFCSAAGWGCHACGCTWLGWLGLLSLSIRVTPSPWAPLHGPLYTASPAEELDFLPRISGLLRQHLDNEPRKERIWPLPRGHSEGVGAECVCVVHIPGPGYCSPQLALLLLCLKHLPHLDKQ